MEFYEVIEKRYSCRSYQDKKIEKDILEKIIEAARKAPSARNIQPWHFYIVQNPEIKKQLQVAAKDQKFISQAAAVIVGTGINVDYTMTCGYKGYVLDLAIAMENITLAATSEGLGSCWVGAFKRDDVKQILNLPQDEEPVQMLTLGYPADKKRERSLKELSDLITLI